MDRRQVIALGDAIARRVVAIGPDRHAGRLQVVQIALDGALVDPAHAREFGHCEALRIAVQQVANTSQPLRLGKSALAHHASLAEYCLQHNVGLRQVRSLRSAPARTHSPVYPGNCATASAHGAFTCISA